jgi:HAD superfamily hydrolase (TIGR01490 family)
MKQKLAIFDIDGTIFRSSLLIELVEALIHEGVFERDAALIYQRAHKQWLDRKGSYEDYISSVVRAFVGNLKGVRYCDFLRVSNKVIALHKDRAYRFTRDLAKDLKRRGYYLVAVSHSPKGIVEPFAKHLGFHKVYGIIYELDGAKERFNGKLLYEDLILDKAKIVRRVLEKEPVTLRGSVGVGDTESDIPFLKLVDRPICFNPNRKLLATAKRHGWKVVVERKDVIYEIQSFKRNTLE